MSIQPVFSNILTPKFPDDGQMTKDNNAYIDKNVDYTKFMGRVSDKSKNGNILKVKVENNNTKFLKAGDIVYFRVNNHKSKDACKASVRSVENFYFSMYVQDFGACWSEDRYFPRGMQLNFDSEKLSDRVFEASKYREILILRKESFLSQLNEINYYLWTFEQQKIKEAAKYDEQINELLREKRLAMDNLTNKKEENIILQHELGKKLNSIDESLNHYKVERQEYLTDRWYMDHEQSLPVFSRPRNLKKR
jgi:hypothetical protein